MPEQFQNKTMKFTWCTPNTPQPKNEGGLSHEVPPEYLCVSGHHDTRLTSCYCHWSWDATPMHGGTWVEQP